MNAGRFAAAAAVAGKPGVYYAGAASGGVWKSTDGGATWKPTFDDQTSQAIGALAVSQSNPNIVWAGTGEAWAVRDMDMMGDGIYKSTDAGETWTSMGLDETGPHRHDRRSSDQREHRAGLRARPRDGTAARARRFPHRGWRQDLAARRSSSIENTGCSGLQISQQDPNIVLASTWEIELQTHVLNSGGMGSGIHLSNDGGQDLHEDHRTRAAAVRHTARPTSRSRRPTATGCTRSSRPERDGVKGLQSEAQGSLWRSDDGGATWSNVSWDRRLIGRAGYYIRIRVSPDDPDHLLIANSTLWRSRDGGKIWVERRRRMRRLS